MNRENLRQLEDNFQTFIAPLLNGKDLEDNQFTWEFENFLQTKTLQVLTAERHGMKKWIELSLSR